MKTKSNVDLVLVHWMHWKSKGGEKRQNPTSECGGSPPTFDIPLCADDINRHIHRHHGSRSNRRQEAKEEVVEVRRS